MLFKLSQCAEKRKGVNGRLKLKIAAPIVLVCVLLTTSAVLPTSNLGNPEVMGPVMDDIYFTVIEDTYGAFDEWKAGNVHVTAVPEYGDIPIAEGPPYFGYVYPYSSFTFMYFDWNVEGWDPQWGFPQHGFPLNETHFRRATAHLTDLENLIATDPYYTGFVRRDIGSWFPEQYQMWHNPNCKQYPTDWDAALAEMDAGNYTYHLKSGYTEPVPGGIDYWTYDADPEHAVGPTGRLRDLYMYGTSAWGGWYQRPMEAWLTKMKSFGLSFPDANIKFLDWGPYKATVWAGDYDFNIMDTTWSKIDPVIMSIYFYSENIWPGCCNWRHLNDMEIDGWIETYSTTTNLTLAVEAAWNLQAKAADLCIMAPAWTEIVTLANNKDLQGFRRTASWVDWNLGHTQIKWRTPEAADDHRIEGRVAYKYRLSGEPTPDDMNPFKQISTISSWLLGLLQEAYGGGFGLSVYHPLTGEATPWIAWKWTEEEIDLPGQPGEKGTKITYYLRDDVYWQDGVQFTAEDIKFSIEQHDKWGWAGGQGKWALQNLWKVEIADVDADGWNEAIVYQNVTNPYVQIYTGQWGASVAKHVWEPEIKGPDGILNTEDDVDPRTIVAHETPNPSDPEGKLTLLTGTGPFEFHLGDWERGVYIRFRANRDYWRSFEISIADVNFDFIVDIFDLLKVAGRFLAPKGDPRYSIYSDINCDKLVDLYDLLIVAGKYLMTW